MKKHFILVLAKIHRKREMNSQMNLLNTVEWNEVILVSMKGKLKRGIEFIRGKLHEFPHIYTHSKSVKVI